jgi:hypothetical protein
MARKKTTSAVGPPQTINFDAAKAQQLADQAARFAECVAKSLALAESKGIKTKPLESLCLAPAQRDVLPAVPGIPKSVITKLRKQKESFTFAAVAGLMMTAVFPQFAAPFWSIASEIRWRWSNCSKHC